jgi:uncharacterized lipoprotein NlpE involved in copper resistance
MIIKTILVGIGLSVALVGCDNPRPVDRTVEAQQEANEKVATATREADQDIAEAHKDAEKKIANAEADVAQAREDYRHKTNEQLTELDRQIAILDAKLETTQGAVHEKLESDLATIRAKRAAFDKDWKDFDGTADADWEATKARFEQEWRDLKDAVDRAS